MPHHEGMRALRCKFELSPPRNFLYPAVLLLIWERPQHGYGLVKGLSRMGFGKVDRPSVYRTLGNLEEDGFVESSEAPQTAGPPRQVYRPTPEGEAILHRWMEIIAAEKKGLDRVLSRFEEASDQLGPATRREAV